MKRLIILYLAFLISAAFDQIQGTFFLYDFFPLSDIKMTWSEYFSWITKFLGVSIIMWDMAMQEIEYHREFIIAAVLATGFIADFMIECTEGWFDIGIYAFGYRSLVFIIFGIVLIYTFLKKK